MLGKVVFIFLFCHSIYSVPLKEVLLRLEDHDLVKSHLSLGNATRESALIESSWGDPKLTVKIINIPRDSLSSSKSMMSGIQVGIKQKISLSSKYKFKKEALESKALMHDFEASQLKRRLTQKIWNLAIRQFELECLVEVYRENLSWIKSNLKISRKLYKNGHISQQAITGIQIRKNDLQSEIIDKLHQISSISYEVSLIVGSDRPIDLKLDHSDWSKLNFNTQEDDNDFKLKVFKYGVKFAQNNLSAMKSDFFPDLDIGINYTKRNDIDQLGDFIGANISFDIPSSDKRYSKSAQAYYQNISAQKKLAYYKKNKKYQLKKIEIEISSIKEQISLLESEALSFSKISRDVNAKSYARGQSNYIELLSSELIYQNQRIKKIKLQSKLRLQQVMYKFIKGEL